MLGCQPDFGRVCYEKTKSFPFQSGYFVIVIGPRIPGKGGTNFALLLAPDQSLVMVTATPQPMLCLLKRAVTPFPPSLSLPRGNFQCR